jgi:hypothetical protein
MEEPDPGADLIMGFGHFDLRIPLRCRELALQNPGAKILFTGGIGAGSGGFREPEAIEFRNYLLKQFPDFDQSRLLIESSSTNTSQNIEFSLQILQKESIHPGLLNQGFKIAAVATPVRQRRVFQTLKKNFPQALLFNIPPVSTLETDLELFSRNNEILETTLIGEVERLIAYPAKGWIEKDSVPDPVLRALERIKKSR